MEPLRTDSMLAAAPRRVLVTAHSSTAVRWYYDVWEHLPQVEVGLFGRGAVALSEQGQRRVDALPPLLRDDLSTAGMFEPHERCVVEGAVVRVPAPHHLLDLLRRRVLVVTGNAQAEAAGIRRADTRATWGDLCRVVVRHPLLAPKVPLFLAVTAVSRLLARKRVREVTAAERLAAGVHDCAE